MAETLATNTLLYSKKIEEFLNSHSEEFIEHSIINVENKGVLVTSKQRISEIYFTNGKIKKNKKDKYYKELSLCTVTAKNGCLVTHLAVKKEGRTYDAIINGLKVDLKSTKSINSS